MVAHTHTQRKTYVRPNSGANYRHPHPLGICMGRDSRCLHPNPGRVVFVVE